MKRLSIFIFITLVGCSKSTDIPVREKYWTQEIKSGLPIGSEKAAIESFFSARGQKLECFTQDGKTRTFNDGKLPNACSVDDKQSLGGFSNVPVRLAVEIEMKEGKMISYKFGTTLATSF